MLWLTSPVTVYSTLLDSPCASNCGNSPVMWGDRGSRLHYFQLQNMGRTYNSLFWTLHIILVSLSTPFLTLYVSVITYKGSCSIGPLRNRQSQSLMSKITNHVYFSAPFSEISAHVAQTNSFLPLQCCFCPGNPG